MKEPHFDFGLEAPYGYFDEEEEPPLSREEIREIQDEQKFDEWHEEGGLAHVRGMLGIEEDEE